MKYLYVLIFLIVAVPSAQAQTYYMANLSNAGQSATVTVNGYPVITPLTVKDASLSSPLNAWIYNGKNTVTIHLESRQSTVSPSLDFKIVRQNAAGDATDLLTFSYPPKKNAGEREKASYPYDAALTFSLADTTPSGFWKAGEILKLDDATRAEAESLVQQLLDAYVKRDIAKAVELREYMLKDTAASFGMTEETTIKSFRDVFPEMVNSPGFKPQPLNKKEFRYILFGDRKVIKITAPDGSSPLVFTTKTGRFWVDIYLGRINGKLVFIR